VARLKSNFFVFLILLSKNRRKRNPNAPLMLKTRPGSLDVLSMVDRRSLTCVI
jgi:hypothetical protein